LMAYKSSTDYKVVNSNGEWVDDSTTDFHPIILNNTDDDNTGGKYEFEISISLSSAINNFYSTGTPKLYLGLYGDTLSGFKVKYNSVSLSLSGTPDETIEIDAGADFIKDKEITFFHADGDAGDNQRLRFSRPIYDDATPKAFITSWEDDEFSSVNLEDIAGGHIAAAYNDNSQIWSGTIQGDVDISKAVTVPLNLNREYQIQRISRNLVNKYNSLTMVEIVPSEAYYIELATDVTNNYIYLSTAYGDLTGLGSVFPTAGGYTIQITDLRNKSTGAVVLTGGSTDIDASTFTGGRTRLQLADIGFDVSLGGDTEVKGIIRKV